MLLGVVREAVKGGLDGGAEPKLSVGAYPAEITAPRASFVTLTLGGKLRGCIGSLQARLPLALDVAHNAFRAAFKDLRFQPVTTAEFSNLHAAVSVLTAPVELDFDSEASLVALLRAGVDGVILAEGNRRGTFLPDVWETLPKPQQFLRRLKHKAGLPDDYWSPTLKAWRYTTEAFSEPINHAIH